MYIYVCYEESIPCMWCGLFHWDCVLTYNAFVLFQLTQLIQIIITL